MSMSRIFHVTHHFLNLFVHLSHVHVRKQPDIINASKGGSEADGGGLSRPKGIKASRIGPAAKSGVRMSSGVSSSKRSAASSDKVRGEAAFWRGQRRERRLVRIHIIYLQRMSWPASGAAVVVTAGHIDIIK